MLVRQFDLVHHSLSQLLVDVWKSPGARRYFRNWHRWIFFSDFIRRIEPLLRVHWHPDALSYLLAKTEIDQALDQNREPKTSTRGARPAVSLDLEALARDSTGAFAAASISGGIISSGSGTKLAAATIPLEIAASNGVQACTAAAAARILERIIAASGRSVLLIKDSTLRKRSGCLSYLSRGESSPVLRRPPEHNLQARTKILRGEPKRVLDRAGPHRRRSMAALDWTLLEEFAGPPQYWDPEVKCRHNHLCTDYQLSFLESPS